MSRPPAVVVDAFAALVPGGGIGRFVRLLARALRTLPGAPPVRFAVTRNLRAAAAGLYRAEEILALPLAWRELALAMMVGARTGLAFDRVYGRPAVVHSTVGYGPRFREARLINQVHDLTFVTNPEWHTGKVGALFSAAVPAACRAARLVVTDCEAVRRQVIALFGVPPERVRSVPLPLDPGFVPAPAEEARRRVAARFGLDGPFVLHVSTLEPRKNQVRLVAAFERLRGAGFPGPLAMVGPDGWKCGPILERIRASRETRHILRLNAVPDEELAALYRAATLTAFPSLAEGFGYPLLESMACGTPCVISEDPALVELAAGAALAAPAADPAALGDAMVRLWRDGTLRAALERDGLARARDFGFEAWAHRMFAIYREELAASAS